MKKFEIRFPSFLAWWEFWSLVSSRKMKASFLKYTITCACTESEIELATFVLQAKAIEVT